MGARRAGEDGNGTPGVAAVFAGAALLGFAALFVRWAEPAGPLVIGFYRMLFALPFVAWMGWRVRRPGAGAARGWALLAGGCFVADLWMWHTSLLYTSAANSTLLVGLAPLWVAAISVLWLGTRLRKRFMAGLLLALAGGLVLGFAKGARWGTGRGELLAALASVAYGCFTLALGRARRELAAPEALAWVILCCLVGFGLLGWAKGEAFHGFAWTSWAALVGLGLVVQVAAWWLITWGLGHVSTNLGSVTLMVQPVATIGLGWLLLGEAIRPLQGGGILLILSGFALSALNPPAKG
ncbi:MAG TPA: DMT family transporter [Holophagaceae bacterium]